MTHRSNLTKRSVFGTLLATRLRSGALRSREETMPNITRRSFVAAGVAGAAVGGFLATSTFAETLSGGSTHIRHDASTPEGKANLKKLAKALEKMGSPA